MKIGSHLAVRAIRTWIALLFLAWSASALGQAYPQKPIRIVVPFTPAGPPDIVARAVSQKLSEGLGQQVFVENRAGVGGALGTASVAKSPADGYTLLFGTTAALLMAPALFQNVGFDPANSFAPIAMLGRTSFVLVVNASSPVKTLGELIALAKSKPGQLNYAAGMAGTPPHIVMEMFKTQAQVNIVTVHYKGSAPGLTALLAGEVQVAVDQLAGLRAHIAAGKMRPLVVTTEKRTRQLPDVPSAPEAGVPGFVAGAWFGIVAPRGTPDDVIKRLHAEIVKAIGSKELSDLLDKQGLDYAAMSPQEFLEVIRVEAPKWAAAVKASGARVE